MNGIGTMGMIGGETGGEHLRAPHHVRTVVQSFRLPGTPVNHQGGKAISVIESLAGSHLFVSRIEGFPARWKIPVRRAVRAGQRFLQLVSAPERLVIPPGVWRHLMTHLQAARPHEGVGLLAVKASPWFGPLMAVRFYPGTNILHSATRFAMDGREVLDVFRDMRERGWELGAIVHSHPAGPATPSPTDLREAHYPQALMLIVSFANRQTDTRAWRIERTDPATIRHEVPVLRWWPWDNVGNRDWRARRRRRNVSQYRTGTDPQRGTSPGKATGIRWREN